MSLVFGAILGVLFWLAAYYNDALDTRSADIELETVLGAISAEIQGDPQARSLDEVLRSPRGVSIAIFGPDGTKTHEAGSLRLVLVTGRGVRQMSGSLVRFVSGETLGRTVVVADNWQDNLDAHARVYVMMILIWFPLTAIVGGITWLTVTRTFRPLLAMADEAKVLSSRGPGSRLAVPEDAEFGPLAERLNEFIDRIQSGVRFQERFVADAAHELRTPLTILRGQVETTLLRERSATQYAEVLNLVLDEAVRMSELVESLLVSSQASVTMAEDGDLTVPVQEAVDRWTPRFQSAKVSLKSEIHPASAPILLREIDSLLDNLLGNALRHSSPGATCWVVLNSENGRAVVSVSDEGPGIPDEAKERVFERFYRTDASRNRDAGGFGIGLAICKRIANERGATIKVLDNVPTGTKFVVSWA